MPKTTKSGDAKKSELPSTLQRSPKKAQRTFAKTYDSAADSYGSGQRAARTAYSSLKHSFEKVGDHWEPKDEKGPSDAQAAKDTSSGSRTGGDTKGGVDANASKKHLYDLAKRLDVPGRSTMSKDELVDAVQRANDKQTRTARGD